MDQNQEIKNDVIAFVEEFCAYVKSQVSIHSWKELNKFAYVIGLRDYKSYLFHSSFQTSQNAQTLTETNSELEPTVSDLVKMVNQTEFNKKSVESIQNIESEEDRDWILNMVCRHIQLFLSFVEDHREIPTSTKSVLINNIVAIHTRQFQNMNLSSEEIHNSPFANVFSRAKKLLESFSGLQNEIDFFYCPKNLRKSFKSLIFGLQENGYLKNAEDFFQSIEKSLKLSEMKWQKSQTELTFLMYQFYGDETYLEYSIFDIIPKIFIKSDSTPYSPLNLRKSFAPYRKILLNTNYKGMIPNKMARIKDLVMEHTEL